MEQKPFSLRANRFETGTSGSEFDSLFENNRSNSIVNRINKGKRDQIENIFW